MKKIAIIGSCSVLLLAVIATLIYVCTFEIISVSSSYEGHSQEEYMELADVVIEVEVVKNVETKYTNPDFTIKSARNENEFARNVLVTYSLVKVKDVIKNDVNRDIKVNDEILIREFGGKYGNTKTVVDNSEIVKKGEEYVMFLFNDSSDIADRTKQYYVLSNPSMAKFEYDKSTDEYVNVNNKSKKSTVEEFKTMYEQTKLLKDI